MAERLLPDAIDAKRRRGLVTPEGVDLSLRLADMGQRAGAYLLDLLIMFVAMVLLTILAGVGLASGAADSFAAILWLLGFFLIRNFYFILMEAGPRAATWGKRALGLRVVARSGERLSVDRVIARNMVREIEFYLPISFLIWNLAESVEGDGLLALLGLGWTILFLLFPLFNRDRLRVGDLLAGTWVISTPRRKLGLDLLRPPAERGAIRFTPEQLDVYGVYELQTLEQVLRDPRGDAVEEVAATIRTKIGGWEMEPDPRAFLQAYYEAARGHMERNLLFGRRRADKHDR